MKTRLFSFVLFAVVAIFFFSSCKSNTESIPGPGISKMINVNTSVDIMKPILESRFDCSGRILPEPKYLGEYPQEKNINQIVECGFSNQELSSAGYVYNPVNTKNNRDPLFWQGLIWLYGILLFGLIAWILWSLIKKSNSSASSQNQPNNSKVAATTQDSPKKEDTPAEKSQASENGNLSNEQLKIILKYQLAKETIQIIAEKGGSYRIYGDGGTNMYIKEQITNPEKK